MSDELGGLTTRDLRRLKEYDPWGSADCLHERNWCAAMAQRGLLKYGSGDCSGARNYDITSKGREALRGLKHDAFDPAI